MGKDMNIRRRRRVLEETASFLFWPSISQLSAGIFLPHENDGVSLHIVLNKTSCMSNHSTTERLMPEEYSR
jgi:hypothetical protein